jgi:outer membrane protein TolC
LFSAGQVLELSLEDAQQYAIENNYDVKNANYNLEIAEYTVKENIARGLPQIDGSADYTYYLQLPTTIVPGDFIGEEQDLQVQFGTKNNLFINLNLYQLIFDTRYFIGLKYSQTLKQKSMEEVLKSEIDVKALVAQTYYNILISEESLSILDSTKAVLEKTRYETGELFKEGFAEETDFDQLTLTITDIDNSINEVKRQKELGFDLLRYQLALPIDQQIILTETLDDILEKIQIEMVLQQEFKLEQNIDFRIINSQEQMSLLNIKNERSSYFPTINGFLNYQTSAQRNELFTVWRSGYPWLPSSSVGVSLYVPIFSSGQRKARLSGAKVQLEMIKNSKMQLRQSLELRVLQARASFRTAVQNYFRETENVELSLKIYRKTLIKYDEGVVSSVELTQQHNQYFESQSKYFQTVLDLLSAKIELDKTLGNYNRN